MLTGETSLIRWKRVTGSFRESIFSNASLLIHKGAGRVLVTGQGCADGILQETEDGTETCQECWDRWRLLPCI